MYVCGNEWKDQSRRQANKEWMHWVYSIRCLKDAVVVSNDNPLLFGEAWWHGGCLEKVKELVHDVMLLRPPRRMRMRLPSYRDWQWRSIYAQPRRSSFLGCRGHELIRPLLFGEAWWYRGCLEKVKEFIHNVMLRSGSRGRRGGRGCQAIAISNEGTYPLILRNHFLLTVEVVN